MHEARFYDPIDSSSVRCRLCPHQCRIADGRRGLCNARLCRDGALYAATYAEITSTNMDPIEKKPLYHFHPGKAILSVGTYGCNLRCLFCQNSTISQQIVPTRHAEPAQIVELARRQQSVGIAYTYNEPLIWAEFLIDTARLAHEAGLVNVLVTNGFVNPEPLAEIVAHVDAANLDIKAIRDEVYQRACGATLAPVLESARRFAQSIHLEVTHLIVTGLNDSDEDLTTLANWIADNLGRDTPTHLSRYFPQYRYNEPSTSPARMESAFEIFRERLDYVYLGNLASRDGANTYCRSCGALLVARAGYAVRIENLTGRRCAACGAENRFVV